MFPTVSHAPLQLRLLHCRPPLLGNLASFRYAFAARDTRAFD
jgi:hypothetical protein